MVDINKLHKRNKHNGSYDFPKLIAAYQPLGGFVALNKYGTLSIDFFDQRAVKALNKALLICYYGVEYWDIPDGYLCPPIPGRADYIHNLADLIDTDAIMSSGRRVRCLDVGVGANCVYPIIGCAEYGWDFVGSDIDPVSIENARRVVAENGSLRGHVELRLQRDAKMVFGGVVRDDEFFDLTICNPPFHASQRDAERGTLRKLANLRGRRETEVALNFGGRSNELWCDGGELGFLLRMIAESRQFWRSCLWFTTLVSKEESLTRLCAKLKDVGVSEYRVIGMEQGNKRSRILAWKVPPGTRDCASQHTGLDLTVFQVWKSGEVPTKRK